MKDFIKRFWLPLLTLCVIASQAIGMAVQSPFKGDPGFGFIEAERTLPVRDTIRYVNQFIKSPGEIREDTSFLTEIPDTVKILTARDTIFPPDSLKDIDPFRYKYYVALFDSLTHRIVVDSLRIAGDSLDWPRIDSIYYRDSAIRAKAEFDAWYAGMTKIERKKYDSEVKQKLMKRINDSIAEIKDSIAAYKDSVRQATPRILDAFAIPDSMQYKRIISWTHEREFHKMDVAVPDTSYNTWINDFPFRRKDVNATWLGVSGSAVQYYNYFNRKSENGVSFYDAYEPWSYSATTVPLYNSKTAYTELSYFGTLLANSDKISDNLHILTTQNIYPQLNYAIEYNRYGGSGMMENETTANKTFAVTANWLGERYTAQAGYIRNKVTRSENGGTSDNTMVRDTTLDAREYPVYLGDASSKLTKTTLFLDQQYRIPFTFIKKIGYNRQDKAFADSIRATGDSVKIQMIDSLVLKRKADREAADTMDTEDITTAFIGHSTEYSVFSRLYSDEISEGSDEAEFFRNAFYYSPNGTSDSVRVMKLENRIFLRLQPWSDDAIVSKLNAGIGNRVMNYYLMDPTFTKTSTNEVWNSTFLYAGVEGQLRNAVRWDATGDYVFLGKEINDFSVKANAELDFYPFRKARKSPVSFKAHFETSLDEPEFYYQHYFSNHFKWENDFGKISTTKIQASLDIPRWKLKAEAGYALLSGNIYYDTLGVVRQNNSAMSVFSASLSKGFKLGPVRWDNRLLFQLSSDQDVLPLPTFAVNTKLYLQFNIQKVLDMQIGAEAWYNTEYYSPAWNPAIGTFHNQKEEKYTNGPVIDAFVNMQWKRACIFVKLENAGQGWPMDRADYFSAHHYIRTQRCVKLGIYWPFYLQPYQNKKANASGNISGGGGR